MFVYALVCPAICEDRSTLRGGMRLLAEIAHRHGIPITWGIDPASARAFAADLTRWHDAYGDEPLPMLDIAPIWGDEIALNDPRQSAEHIVTMREKLPDYIRAEWNKIQKAMAWADPVVAGAVMKNHVLLYALEQVGFKGLWGYRWEDSETDRGCPFGCFYPSTDGHHFGGYPASRIVGVPYASINPTQAYPASEETDAADLQAQLLMGSAQRTFDGYAANAKWNRWLAYIQSIDAASVTALTSDQLDQLDAHLAYVCQRQETQIASLADVVRAYRQLGEQTQPTFLLLEASNAAANSSLFYYDAECQLIFDQDKMGPVHITNYISPPVNSRYGIEFRLPQIERFRPSRSRNQLRMPFVVESAKAMPYGLAIWGNHAGLTLKTSNAQAVKWLGERLLFVRVDLQPGENEIEVVLTI